MTRTHFELIWQQTGFHRSSEIVVVSVDRNFLHGGSSCGKSCSWLGVAMGAGLAGAVLDPNGQFRFGPVYCGHWADHPVFTSELFGEDSLDDH